VPNCSILDLIFAAIVELGRADRLALDKDFEITADITGQPSAVPGELGV